MKRNLLSIMSFLLFLLHLSVPVFAETDNPGSLLDKLEIARVRGDFQQMGWLRLKLEKLLNNEADAFVRTAIKRALWVEQIPLDGSGIFDYDISAMESDGDDIWIGSRSGDIARYSLSERSWFILRTGAPSLVVRAVNAIENDRDRLWFLSYGSVLIYDKRQGSSFPVDLPDHADYRGMQSLSLLGRGILVGTQSGGFRRILPNEETVIPIEGLRNICYLKRVESNCLMAGTEEDGLFMLDQAFRPVPVISNNRQTSSVRTILKGDGYYLAGSYGNGIFMLRGEEYPYDFKKFHTKGSWITDGIEINEGYCFSSLGNGLIYMDKKDLTIRTAGIADGLPSLDITSMEYSAPYIICGTQGQGLLVVHENFFK